MNLLADMMIWKMIQEMTILIKGNIMKKFAMSFIVLCFLSGCNSVSVDQVFQPDGTQKITVWNGMFKSQTFYLHEGQKFSYVVNRKTGDVQIIVVDKDNSIHVLKEHSK